MLSDYCDYPSPRISLICRHPTSVSHGRGHWFDPSTAHHSETSAEQGSRKFPGSLLFSEWWLLRHFGTVLGQCQWRDRVKRHPGELSYGDDRETRSILESEDPSRRPYGADQDFR